MGFEAGVPGGSVSWRVPRGQHSLKLTYLVRGKG